MVQKLNASPVLVTGTRELETKIWSLCRASDTGMSGVSFLDGVEERKQEDRKQCGAVFRRGLPKSTYLQIKRARTRNSLGIIRTSILKVPFLLGQIKNRMQGISSFLSLAAKAAECHHRAPDSTCPLQRFPPTPADDPDPNIVTEQTTSFAVFVTLQL